MKFEIREIGTNQYRWYLETLDGEVISESAEAYPTTEVCRHEIEALKDGEKITAVLDASPVKWEISKLAHSIVAKLEQGGTPTDQLNSLLAYHSTALAAFSIIYQDRFPHASLLGMGGSGIVLKLTGTTGAAESSSEPTVAPKCLKYPHPCIGLPGKFSLIDIIDNEAQRLGEIAHPNIMPLEETVCADLPAEIVSARDRRVPAYLMPYIRSSELSDFLMRPEATADQMITLLFQVSKAIAYLHNREFVHLDIKPANILVAMDQGVQIRALLSDFGFCKHMVIDSKGKTDVVGTDGYMDPDLVALMTKPTTSNKNRIRDSVLRSELKPQFDRYSFGATILDAIVAFLKVRETDGNPRTVPTSLWRGLVFIALRCSGRNPRAMRSHDRYPDRKEVAPEGLFEPELGDAFSYKSSDDLTDDLLRLQGGRLALLEPEVAETTGDAVCLPERMFAPLSPRVIHAIDSCLIRRLATISQLALCYHVYPGASHTRKEHVIGTYRTACHLIRQLILDPANPIGAMLLKPPQQRLAMLAALLHDMSHIPLLHEFEDSIPELSQKKLTSELLGGEWGGGWYGSQLQEVVSKWDVSLDDLRAVIGDPDSSPQKFMGETTQKDVKEKWGDHCERPELQLIRSIVDGAVDADKIDYLQRDSLHVGVRFGLGVDRERIQTQMTTVVTRIGSGQKLKIRCRMGTWRKGQAAAESLIGVRHSMYSQVYAHRTVRAARAMLNYIAWKWRVCDRYEGLNGEVIAKELFGFASSLEPEEKQKPLFEPHAAELPSAVAQQITDNLPYAESRVIRWMALISGDDSAYEMAEALISRRLYKQVCTLSRNEADAFIKEVFPKKDTVHSPSKLSASHWLSLTNYLAVRLWGYLSNGTSSVSISPSDATLPPLLIDIAIPKTMRTQAELSVVQDTLSGEVSWRRISRIGERPSVLPGTIVSKSPVYEAFGGAQDDSLSPISIRLFAQSDLAANLRARIDGGTVAGWLETFRSEDEKV